VFLGLASLLTLLYPQAMRIIVDEALGQGDTSVIDLAVGALLVLFVVQAASTALRYYLFTVAGERIVARLRARLYRSIVSQEIAFFDQRRTGELINRLGSDTTVLQNTVSVNVSMAMRNLASIVGGIVFLLYTSPALTLLIAVVVPPVAIGAVLWGRRLRRLSRDVQDALASASEVAEESIAGIRTVRAFTAEEAEAARYGAAVDQAFERARRRSAVGARFVASVSFAGYASAAVVLWWGGRMVIDGTLSVGGLAAFLFYTLIVAFSLGALSDLWADFMKASGAAERVFDLLDRAPAMPSGGARLDRVEGRVRFEAVRFAYPARPDVTVLAGLDLELAPGEVVALVGPSGAGKSTVAALLGRLYDPEDGRITLDGRDIRELDPDWFRQRIGVVAQEPVLFSTSIAENIRYGRPDASDEELEEAARVANAHGFVSSFPDGYQTNVGERGVQLSGGQKQRVAIARAILEDPRILILDEATSALDAESEHLVQEALERLMKGRTTLVIAHRLSTVAGADRVVVLAEGEVVQTGDHAALMSEDGLYRRLVERQFVAA
jgi:ATP-binding cassette subfamily B protein